MLQLSKADGALQSSLTRSVLVAPSYRQQVGKLFWAGMAEKQDLTSTSNADQDLKLILMLCAPRYVLQQEQKIFMGLVKKAPNHQGSKAAPSSCTRLKENPKLTKVKVQPSCIIKWKKDHTHSNSNKFWGRKRQHSAALQHSFRWRSWWLHRLMPKAKCNTWHRNKVSALRQALRI